MAEKFANKDDKKDNFANKWNYTRGLMSQIANPFWIFLTGICMGAADIVPGVSGGTMAFIMGSYEELLAAIKSFHFATLLRGDLRGFFKKISWRFLVCLFGGIALSFLFLSQSVHFLLSHEIYRTILYAGFFGLIISSALFLIRQIKKWRFIDFCALAVGGSLAYISTVPQTAGQLIPVSHDVIQPWLILCGALAVGAMLLPGISGSYLLVILGVYPVAIAALSDFLNGLKGLHIDWHASLILANLMAGIILGGLFFSRIIHWLLKKYQQATLALLIGFMIGALKTVWPFWTYTYLPHPLKADKGLVLSLLNPILPDIHSLLFLQATTSAIAGFLLVVLMEYAVNSTNLKKTK